MIGLYFTGIYYLGKEVFERKNPISTSSSTEISNPTKMLISSSQFPIMFSVESRNGISYIDESIFKPKAYIFR